MLPNKKTKEGARNIKKELNLQGEVDLLIYIQVPVLQDNLNFLIEDIKLSSDVYVYVYKL